MTGQQLKNSILQMAVQGKLVPQDPNDEPASVLLERIRAEKEQLIKEGKIKKEKNPSVIFRGADNLPYEKVGKNEPVCIADEVPFDIPESWAWCRLKTILQKLTDGTHATPKYVEEGIPFISVKDISAGELSFDNAKHISIEEHQELYKRCDPQRGDILLSKVGTTGIPVIVNTDIEFSLFVSVAQLRFSHELMDADFLVWLLKSPLVQKQCTENTRGVGNKNWVMRDIANTLIVIPPLKEQKRIVCAIKKIKPYTDKYTDIASTLDSLNANFPDQLKKSILQMAVQGKLVPQDPTDEPASVLLERIRAEKEQLIRQGKIKRDKHESVIFRRDNSYYEKIDEIERCIDDEIPFEIPESWGWCRLKSLTENITSGSRDWAKYYSTTGAAFLRMGNLSKNSFDLRLEHIQRVTIPSKAEGTRTSLQSGDLLFSITGDVGMLGLIPDGFEKAYINQHTAMIRFLPEMRNKYIPYLLLTDYAQKFYNANQHGIKNSFRLDSIGELLVSIPPEKELFRILQRISLVLSKIAVL